MKAINKTLTYVACAAMMLSQVASLTSCKNEEDDLFSSSAAERLMQTEKDYTQRLAASEGGWAFEYYPTTFTINPNEDAEAEYLPQGIGYLMMAKFNKDNSVVVGMKNEFTNNSYKEDSSAWEIISDNGPVLTFNTFNEVLHTFSNPYGFSNSLGSGDDGEGVGGDYEFVVIDCKENADRVTLKGKKRGSYSRLTRVPAGTDFEAYIQDIADFKTETFGASAPNGIVLNMGEEKYNVVDITSLVCNIYPYDGDVIADATFHPFLITKNGDNYYLRFRDPFVATDGMSVQEFKYDAEKEMFIGVEDENATLVGPDPNKFFFESANSGRTWTMDGKSASDNVIDIYNRIATKFKSVAGATLTSISLKKNDKDSENIDFIISYRIKKNATAVYTLSMSNDPVSFGYVAPKNDASANMLTSIPEIKEMIDIFLSSFEVKAAENQFKLNKVKLENGNTWFVLGI